jgi:hypothetical protein
MLQHKPTSIVKLAAMLFAIILALAAITATAGAKGEPKPKPVPHNPIYDNIPSHLPGNVPSQAFEATSTSEFGGQIGLTRATQKKTKVTIGMSSWACQSGVWWESSGENKCVTKGDAKFSLPVTLKVYSSEPDGSVGSLVTEVTQTFKIPYRPSATENCGEGGGWGPECFHGKLSLITFQLENVSIPSNAIVSVAYNTSDYGTQPQRPQPCNAEPQGCPYDSLNVAVEEPENEVFGSSPFAGTQPRPDDAYLSSTWSGAYCDNGTEGTGKFRLDAGCWEGYQPLITVTTDK